MIGFEFQYLSQCSVRTYLKKRGGLMKLLTGAYPNHQFVNKRFFPRQKKSIQWRLYKLIKEILPANIEVVEDYRHPSLKFSDTGCPMIFDVYVPSLNLILEFNGYQHYYNYIFGDAKSLKERDSERYAACMSMGMHLIEVPYWWQCDKASITAILHKYRPDILHSPQVPHFKTM